MDIKGAIFSNLTDDDIKKRMNNREKTYFIIDCHECIYRILIAKLRGYSIGFGESVAWIVSPDIYYDEQKELKAPFLFLEEDIPRLQEWCDKQNKKNAKTIRDYHYGTVKNNIDRIKRGLI